MDDFDATVFWQRVEELRGVKLPIYIKNILKLQHLDNPISFKEIDDEGITDLQNFAAETMGDLLDENCDMKLFYGDYWKKPEKFKFHIGDRHLIRDFVKTVREKDIEFWKKTIAVQNPLQNAPKSKNSETRPLLTSRESGPNISAEEKEVTKGLRKIIDNLTAKCYVLGNKVDGSHSKSSELVSVGDLNIRVSVRELYGEQDLPVSYSYTLKVDCYICKQQIQMAKIPATGKNKSRWVLTNYSRHVEKTHHDLLEDPEGLRKPKKGTKRRNSSILDLMNSSTKMRKCSVKDPDSKTVDISSSAESRETFSDLNTNLENPTRNENRNTLEPIFAENSNDSSHPESLSDSQESLAHVQYADVIVHNSNNTPSSKTLAEDQNPPETTLESSSLISDSLNLINYQDQGEY